MSSDDSTVSVSDDAALAGAHGHVAPAGFWIRAAARILDWLVLGAAGMGGMLLFAVAAGATLAALGRDATRLIESLEQNTIIGWVGSVVATLTYHALFESVAGSTVGKRLVGLQVVSMSLEPITFKQATKRSVAFLVDGLFFGAIAAGEMKDSPSKQRIGDRWAETRVVRRRSLPQELHPPPLQYVAALIAATEVAFIIGTVTQALEYLWFVRGA